MSRNLAAHCADFRNQIKNNAKSNEKRKARTRAAFSETAQKSLHFVAIFNHVLSAVVRRKDGQKSETICLQRWHAT